MKVDIPALLRDRGIKVTTGGQHVTRGWVGTACPFCGGSEHLGWNLKDGYFSCWKCGGHEQDETVAAVLGVTEHEAYMLSLKYQLRPSHEAWADPDPPGARPDKVVVPGGPLTAAAHRYLEGRGYDPDAVARTWGLMATGPTGPYRLRIICPVWAGGHVVSFQGRDHTGRQDLRWKACAKADEVADHKHCLGGSQLATGDSVAVVEGFTDAWRLGPGAVCTFGTGYLFPQVRLIGAYKRRFVVLDSSDKDPNAGRQGSKLADMLETWPGETVLVRLSDGDPGDLDQAEADYLMEKEWKVRK